MRVEVGTDRRRQLRQAFPLSMGIAGVLEALEDGKVILLIGLSTIVRGRESENRLE